MKTFYRWLESTNDRVFIDLTKFKKELMQALQKLIDWQYERQDRAANHKLNMDGIYRGTKDYPGKNELYAALQTNDVKRVMDEREKYSRWERAQIGSPGYNITTRQDVWQYLSDHINFLLNKKPEVDFEKNYMVAAEKIIVQTQENMEKLKSSIEAAIDNIPTWSDSPVTLVAQPIYDNRDVELAAGEGAEVKLGRDRMAPSFSLWLHEGKFHIDDVLEGGDTDFFQDPETQGDYFKLINELRNPGSSNKTGKILSLYTARPVSDRKTFENATSVPSNLFLTKSYDFAKNFGLDYGKQRDVWKVRIDSRYLTQTYDGPNQEQYQITGAKEVPIKSITLIDAVE